MTETNRNVQSETPEAGVAGSLHDLSEQTRRLVRQEIDAAQQEMWDKAKASAPALGAAALAGALGLFAAASGYRFTLRVLEAAMPRPMAALLATVGYGVGAAGAASYAVGRFRELPPLLPSETARQAGAAVAETAREART